MLVADGMRAKPVGWIWFGTGEEFSANGKLCKFVRGSGKGQKKTGRSGLDAVLEEKMCNQLSVKCL